MTGRELVGTPKKRFFMTQFPSDGVSTEELCQTYYAGFVKMRLITRAMETKLFFNSLRKKRQNKKT